MKVIQANLNTRLGAGTIQLPRYHLNIAREGFIYRGACIYNKLDESLKKETKLEKFKAGVRDWIKTNIPIKPLPRFPSIASGSRRNQPPPPPEPPPPPRYNSIRRYLVPVQTTPASRTLREPLTSSTLSQSRQPRRNTILNYFQQVNLRDLLNIEPPVDDQRS